MFVNINAEISLIGLCIHLYAISANKSSVGKEKSYYQHRHPGFELHYIQSGQCKVTCCSESHILTPGMMILIPPGTYHDVVIMADNTTRLCISFDFHPKKDNISHLTQDFFDRNTPTVTNLQTKEPEYILQRIDQLLEPSQDDPYKNDKLSALCSNLLLELIPYFTGTSANNFISQRTAEPDDRNYKIDSFLGTNFMHNNAKSRMASDLYISPRQLQRVIRKNYGMSYRQKLAETRVQIAIDLLINSDTPIHKISEILGYSCSANFSAFIKRVTGKTPSQIRKLQ